MRKNFPQGIAIPYDREKVADFISRLPFKLTDDQIKAVNEILGDIAAPYQMNRLLQGEVGSGKTVVAAICLYAVITAGYQGAIMAPTEVLVQQHYRTFLRLFEGEPVKIVMLSSSVGQKTKRRLSTGWAIRISISLSALTPSSKRRCFRAARTRHHRRGAPVWRPAASIDRRERSFNRSLENERDADSQDARDIDSRRIGYLGD